MAATDLERLVVQLSADMRRYDNSMKRFTANTNSAAKKVETRFGQMNRTLARQADQFGRSLRQTIAAVAAGYATREVGQLADQWTTLENSLRSVQQAIGRPTASMDELANTAIRTRTALESTTTLYARLERAGGDLGRSQEDMRRVTELTNKAFVAGGAAATEQRSAILQLAQGIASGALQGDELRSIRENAPLVAQAIADAMGVGIGALRDLGAEGRITSEIIVNAILGAGGEIEAQFDATETTVGQAFQNLQTRAAQYVGQLDDATQASAHMAEFINSIADNLDALGEAAIVAASAIGGTLAAGAVARAIPLMLAFTATVTGAGGALGRAAIAAILASRAMGALRGSMMFFVTNPVGIAITAIATAVGYLAYEQQNAASRAERLNAMYERMGREVDELGQATERATRAQERLAAERRQAALEETTRVLREQRQELERMERLLEQARSGRGRGELDLPMTTGTMSGPIYGDVPLSADEARQAVSELSGAVEAQREIVSDAESEVQRYSEAIEGSSRAVRESINLAQIATRANEDLDDVLEMIVDTLGETSDAQEILNDLQRASAIDQATAALQRQVTALEEVEGAIQAIRAAQMAATAVSFVDGMAGEGGPLAGMFALSGDDAAEVAELEAAAERYRRVIGLIRGFMDELNAGTNVGAAKDARRDREQQLRREAEAMSQLITTEREFARALEETSGQLRKGDTEAYTAQMESLRDALDEAQDELAALTAQHEAGLVKEADYRAELERLNGTIAQLNEQTERLIGLQDELDIAKRIVEETQARERLLSAQERQLNFELDLARLRGNDEEIRRLEREVRMRERIAELVETQGVSRGEAAETAKGEEGQREAARRYGEARDIFARSFSDGIRAALSGDLRNFLSNTFGTIADEGFRRLGEQVFDAIFDAPADVAKASAEGTAQGTAAGAQITGAMAAGGTTAASTIQTSMIAAGQQAGALIANQMRLASASSEGGKGLGNLLKAGVSLLSGGKSIPGKAGGGRVQRGQPVVVGEKRPEVFVPDAAGLIVPRVPEAVSRSSDQPANMTVNFRQTIDLTGANGEETIRQIANEASYAGAKQAVEAVEKRMAARARMGG